MWANLPTKYNTWEEEQDMDTLWIYYLNMTTMGVVPKIKLDWCADWLTDKLTQNPVTSIGIIVQTNRAGEDVKKEKTDDDDDEDEEPMKADSDEEEEEKMAEPSPKKPRIAADDGIRKVANSIAEKLAEPTRNLCVRDLQIVFRPSSVYGNRSGVHSALMVASPRDENIFKKHCCGNEKWLLMFVCCRGRTWSARSSAPCPGCVDKIFTTKPSVA